MRAKDYFQRVWEAEQDLRRLKEVKRHYEDLGLSITGRIDTIGGGKGGISSRVESAAVGMVDSDLMIAEQIARYQQIIMEAEKVIGKIDCAKFRQILTLRYLAGWSFSAITDELGYSDRTSIYKAHGFALKEAQKYI